jgi:protein-tyrosine phosphatase
MAAVELQGAYNVRDLGGLRTCDGRRTRQGLVYRGDSLDHLTDSDAELLFAKLGIGAVIDLRTKEETPAAPSPRPVPGYRYSILEEGRLGREPFPSDDPEELAKVYLSNLDHGRAAVAAAIETVARYLSADVPSIFHCAAGRDRTGIISAILLGLAGVTDEQIAADYLASNRHARLVTRKLAANPLYSDHGARGREVILLKPGTILEFLRLLREKFGGPRQFLLDSGVPAETLSVIEQHFVAPVADPAAVPEGGRAAAPEGASGPLPEGASGALPEGASAPVPDAAKGRGGQGTAADPGADIR